MTDERGLADQSKCDGLKAFRYILRHPRTPNSPDYLNYGDSDDVGDDDDSENDSVVMMMVMVMIIMIILGW